MFILVAFHYYHTLTAINLYEQRNDMRTVFAPGCACQAAALAPDRWRLYLQPERETAGAAEG